MIFYKAGSDSLKRSRKSKMKRIQRDPDQQHCLRWKYVIHTQEIPIYMQNVVVSFSVNNRKNNCFPLRIAFLPPVAEARQMISVGAEQWAQY